MGFAADDESIFRHVLDLVNAARYVPLADITQDELTKYVDEVALPFDQKIPYNDLFSQAVDRIINIWKAVFRSIRDGDSLAKSLVKDWNLGDKKQKMKVMEDFSCNEQKEEVPGFQITPESDCNLSQSGRLKLQLIVQKQSEQLSYSHMFEIYEFFRKTGFGSG